MQIGHPADHRHPGRQTAAQPRRSVSGPSTEPVGCRGGSFARSLPASRTSSGSYTADADAPRRLSVSHDNTIEAGVAATRPVRHAPMKSTGSSSDARRGNDRARASGGRARDRWGRRRPVTEPRRRDGSRYRACGGRSRTPAPRRRPARTTVARHGRPPRAGTARARAPPSTGTVEPHWPVIPIPRHLSGRVSCSARLVQASRASARTDRRCRATTGRCPASLRRPG